MTTFNGFDIFGVPLEYATETTRKKRWSAYISKLSELTKVDISRTFHNSIYEIYNCVFLGFLSFQSASYFLLGRFTPMQDKYLRTFNDFLYQNQGLKLAKIHVLWQGQKNVVPANTFLSPLVAQDSSVLAMYDFSEERERFILQGNAGLQEIRRINYINSFDDLPPVDAVMP